MGLRTNHNRSAKKPRTWGLSDIKGFGEKHRGLTIEECIHEDARHVDWLVNNLDWFELDNEAYKLMQEQLGCLGPGSDDWTDYETPENF